MSKMNVQTKTKLDNGEIVHYQACSEKEAAYDRRYFLPIGRGIIYEIDRVRQNFKDKMYFYRRR